MRYAVLGGAGAMGSIVVRDLVETTAPSSEILIADYNIDAAKKLAASYRQSRVRAAHVNVLQRSQTASLLRKTAVTINCVHYHYNLDVMEAALAAGSHYVDLGGLFHMTRKQLKLHQRFKKAGLTALIGMGAAPGITNILARYAAEQMDAVREIHLRVGSSDMTRYKFVPALPVSYSIKTIMEEFSFEPAVFTKGKFTYVEPMSGAVPHKFPSPIGTQHPMYTIHSEVATLPLSYKDRGVREVSFKIAFDPEFVDRVRFLRDVGLASERPVRIGKVAIAPIDLVNQVVMSQPKAKQIGKLKQYEIVRAIVKGMRQGKKITCIADCHTIGMPKWNIGLDIDTGSPPSIAAQMIASNHIATRGVIPAEVAVTPAPFFKELKKRQMVVKKNLLQGWSLPV